VGEVLRAVEGRVTALEVAGRHPGSPGEAAAADLAPLWREIAAAVGTVIDRTTFGELAEQVKARRAPGRAIYHI
jgi:DNA-binding IscR family transcriptional regulator